MDREAPKPTSTLLRGGAWVVRKHSKTWSARALAKFLTGRDDLYNLHVDLDGDDLTIEYETRQKV